MNDTEAVELILATLREVVDEAGEEYSSVSCYYVGNGPQGDVASCIAGRVLSRLGVPLPWLAAHEGNVCHLLPLAEGEYPWATRTALRVLRVAQFSQDNGISWGECLQRAEGAALISKEFL